MKNRISKYILTAAAVFLAAAAAAGQERPAEGFTSVPFAQYLARVAAGNLDYLAERYNIAIADAEVIMQKVCPDPTLGFEAEDATYKLELGYTLELGKRRARVGAARSMAEIEKLGVEWFFQELRAEAAGAYVEALLQKQLLELSKQSYEYMEQLARYDSLRYRAGEITEVDARQSALEASTLYNDVLQQQGDYLAALTILNYYTGDGTLTLFSPEGDIEALQNNYLLADLIGRGIANRVDLVMANKEVDFALKSLKLVRAERRPDIDLSVGFERDWRGFWPKRNMLVAGVSIPLKFSNINKGAVRQAQATINQTRVRNNSVELQIQTEVARAFYQYEALGRQVQRFREGMLDDARKVLDGMTLRYKRGESGILDVLIAQRTYNEVREQYLEKTKEYVLALIEIQRSCGIWDLEF